MIIRRIFVVAMVTLPLVGYEYRYQTGYNRRGEPMPTVHLNASRDCSYSEIRFFREQMST